MALIGSITNYGSLQGTVDNYGNSLTGQISSAAMMGGQVVGMRGLKGDKGDTGDTGATGADGYSPSASVSKVGDTATITITDKDGTTTASISDGADGADGADGQDGADGFSPVANVSKVGDTTTITITDENGTTTATITDPPDKVYIAEYGVTTYNDIKTAFQAGKSVFVVNSTSLQNSTTILPLVQWYVDEYLDVFSFGAVTGLTHIGATVEPNDHWAFSTNAVSSFNHTHGNIQNGGTLQTTDVSIANGDKLVVTDSSNSNKVARTSVEFDGSTTTKYLSQKGTWESSPTKVSDLTNDSNFTTKTYVDTQDASIKGKIFYAQVDDTSTSTAFTATIPGITSYVDGLTVMLKNGIVTSASGFTININNLGAKQAYSNMAAATAETTMFNINYTMLFVYDSTRVEGGGWILYRGYNSNDNTIGYQLRTNSMSLPMKSITYRYRILFTSADGNYFVPANNSSSTNATASRTVCQDKIDPFGHIVYYGTTASVAKDSRPAAANLWEQYVFALGYSFNRTGAALTMTLWKPVYVKCAPQTDGSAIIDSTTPFVQDLPATADGKIYIMLGVAYSATNIELFPEHPVYEYRNGQIRLWTNADIPAATTTTPKMDGTAAVGSETTWAKGDHVHPTDTSRAASSHTHTKSEITDFPSLATVATSGSYTDLSSKPDIHNVPSGGTSGQVLSKDSNDDYDLAWITVSGGGGDVVYATSSDSASTVAKTATIVSGTLTTLASGVQAIVKFDNTNTASSPTLNIGGTGAKSIKRYGTTAVGQNQNESWVAGSPVLFVYDGTNWVIAGWLNTTYSGGTANGITTGTDNLNYIWSPKQIHDGIDGMATATPTASKNSKFDSSAHMNSTDMTAQAVEDFVENLNPHGGGGGGGVSSVTTTAQVEYVTGILYRLWLDDPTDIPQGVLVCIGINNQGHYIPSMWNDTDKCLLVDEIYGQEMSLGDYEGDEVSVTYYYLPI